ncbi:cysteine-rich receptor-like protein kinase, partial [Trifolium medium]|nr:cysteine-rich receptor-like protein kinase [Trifolium medium]
VLAARYGEVAGRSAVGGRRGSAWWREVSRIRNGEGAVVGGWFVESIARRVGNGADTFFWTDPWLGGVPLSVTYRRLFDLATNKSISVADMCELGWEEDLWVWRYDMAGGYSVRGAYALLTTADATTPAVASDLIWHKHVPLKVSVLAWRLLRNRLPTKDNLVARNIISHDACFCVNGCGTLETANHLFLFSALFSLLCGIWWVASSPLFFTACLAVLHFGNMA